MAANTSLLFFFFASLLSFNVSTTFSRDLPESKPNTVALDVSSSLELAQAVLSFDPQTQKPFDEQLASSLPPANFTSSFSLHLHPRDSLLSSNHREYRSLVLSRLARDSDRVNSLNAKLELALGNVRKSDLRPVEIEVQAEDLSAPVISGVSQGSGEYFTRIGVGTPAKQYYMAIDTGSDVNWLQCEPCSDCYQQTDPIFQPGSSSSYSALTCESSQCTALSTNACRNSKCLYQVNYGDGSYTVGDFVTETVSLGNSGSINGFALGCGHSNAGLFIAAAGLIGLGGGPLSLTSQTKSSSFSYCLVNRDSDTSSTLDFNSAPPSDSITAPLVRNGKTATFYYIQVVGMSVGGETISVSPDLFQVDESGNGGIIVDSGTAVTRLRAPIYESLRDAFKKMTPSLRPTSGVALFDTCYDFSSLSSVQVPTVSFLFAGGKSLALPAHNYLVPVDSSGTFCFAFAPTTSSLSIIGNIQQQGTRVSYDLANSRVGFSPGKC
ncbi:protein ASPARTIC PROTEASE IN GUARD CELL 1-like [Humulus lupulus]|uniref:protein ASPARTIC PROTEASE IN GUARD CELL 1-like n=1 Tax=Humulus lupulus TaxID=3486 RepID=UPI002B408FA2|nr:protein ASPARTIC PROTEASE IN GUARD CELL 1-like [Humulus lupulus]